MRWTRWMAVALAVVSFAGVLTAEAQELPVNAGQKAAAQWLDLLDTGKFAESWKAAATGLQTAVTQEKWTSSIGSMRAQFGGLVTRKVQSATYTKQLPGVPVGEYVVVLYQTSFEKKPTAQETVIVAKEKDGVWRVAGYYVK